MSARRWPWDIARRIRPNGPHQIGPWLAGGRTSQIRVQAGDRDQARVRKGWIVAARPAGCPGRVTCSARSGSAARPAPGRMPTSACSSPSASASCPPCCSAGPRFACRRQHHPSAPQQLSLRD